MEFTFLVEGRAEGKDRPRFARGHAFTTQKTREFEAAVRWSAKLAMNRHKLETTDRPVRVKVQAFYKVAASRPKSFKRLIDEKLVPYDKKPDADNVIKAICDGLNGIAYQDDKQVFSMSCEQIYTNSDSYFTVYVSDEMPPKSGTDEGKPHSEGGILRGRKRRTL